MLNSEEGLSPENRKETLKGQLSVLHRDVADYYDGASSMSTEDIKNAEREIRKLEAELNGLDN
ncbi:MAG: hypothetical protein A2469_02135 [Candidatus Magasanikbacteria bacterium RIFOXYC2_FULL_40_16]|uniref:Uncharacterized protein n=2 Tax=Candidatus Magasanikiibacteriota TaxID=1752731 RepID=A0A1F6NJR8_9BACT|nr:MAG: hypothetical protein A2224_01705 [Candidatus Magasanikbacteria bacterium RIFOXYA2_FULL_40_20]OGH84132.1 MAG: hypothetical protein A2373_02745 [Candidatus Magasanikbacteria bacterium RIFOXYB1_FULL_40_15]OGH86765.1 MAG: hypothetical protein A2301_01680 [Candidatus Magasanikbacteria bacterium RIFOXYB2_FULL_40_13]OGH89943.1 MAG: hypothetical protein A2469_02135 [Candidatus Magasanikbacteria bacterium RIFOXYC2_FULL_40_16]